MNLQLDIGGEGRHPFAWNLNTSTFRTLPPGRGQPIPRHILGHAAAIPLPDNSVAHIIVERTPLRSPALREIARIIRPHGTITLRHAIPPNIDPHRLARRLLPGRVYRRTLNIGSRLLQESRFELPDR